MLLLHQVHYHLVDLGLGLKRTGKGTVSSQILVAHRLHGHHAEFLGHTISGDHSSGKLCSLLDIIGSSCSNRTEDHLLCGSSSCKGSDLIFQLLLRHKIMFSIFYLHGIAQSSGSPGDNGNLMHRCGMRLHGSHQSVSHFMVSHNKFFFRGKHLILFLISGDNHFNTLFQICLGSKLSAVPDSPQSRFIYNVCQISAGSSRSCLGDITEIHVIGNLDLSGVNLKDLLSSFQIRKFYRDSPVETSRS